MTTQPTGSFVESARVVIPDSVLMQELDGEAVLLQLEAGKYYGLDRIGTRIWQLLADSPSVQQAYEQLLDEYEVDADRLRSDLERMIGELAQQGLIELRPGDDG